MNSFLRRVFVILFTLTATLSQATKVQDFQLIGQVGSKEFYETGTLDRVSWRAARQACEDAGLKMGTTVNNAEFKYLYEMRKYMDYWIAGAMKGFLDLKTERSFEWDDGTEIGEGININFVQTGDTFTCLYHSGDDHTFVDDCYRGRHLILCQLVLPSL